MPRKNSMGSLILAPWVGGKAKVANRIIACFPPHHCYVEPFGGMASVLLQKPKSETEIYNDLNSRLVNLFLCIKYHADEVSREFDFLLKSRSLFQVFLAQPGFTDIQMAARFLFCLNQGYGGKGKHFGTGVGGGGAHRKSMNIIQHTIQNINKRLASVIIEQEDWEQCLAHYDSPETLFYCDPPYDDAVGYDVAFTKHDQQALAERLRIIKGKFVLHNSDTQFVRRLYRGFHIQPFISRMGLGKRRKFFQLTITNFRIGMRRLRRQRSQRPHHRRVRCRG